MTVMADAAPSAASRYIVRRYYIAMALPFAIDVVTTLSFVLVNNAFEVLLPAVVLSAVFLFIRVPPGPPLPIIPFQRLLHGKMSSCDIEQSLYRLAQHS